ncbi:MAG: type III-A CRISPR-associated RAMP protein Csm5 [Parasporobacterium sp.]|nr:type III-A CRISPR-associated RAMP protein Csm5 [Parasporobacterium sp.]
MKKEYILIPGSDKIIVPDIGKMYSDLSIMGKDRKFEQFLLSKTNEGLGNWLRAERITDSQILKWKKYELDMGDTIQEKGRPLQILAFIKDPYGNPYIPGSSLKGMLRTILLYWEISNNPQRFQGIKTDIRRELNGNDRIKRNTFLSKEEKKIEAEVFNILDRSNKKTDMVNDHLSGLIVSDSLPLSVEDLALCQKVEYHVDAKMSSLNILRECLKPGTQIRFTLSIDTTKCKYSANDIVKAVALFAEDYYRLFINKFRFAEKPGKDSVWLGGGTGFFTKTVMYSLFKENAVSAVQNMFEKTVNQKSHGHRFDYKSGVSPHILKMTKYKGEFYHFGECGIQIN